MATDYRAHLVHELTLLASSFRATTVLSTVYDADWQAHVAGLINGTALGDGGFKSDECPLFMQLRGNDAYVRLLDARLEAYRAAVATGASRKLRELRDRRFKMAQLETLFELSVLGHCAQHGHLVASDVPVGGTASNVDGQLRVAGQDIYVEATLCTQPLTSSNPGVHCISLEALMAQVETKLSKKAGQRKQLGLVTEDAALLVIGLHLFGADQDTARWAIEDALARDSFGHLSGVIVADSWKFQNGAYHINAKARRPIPASSFESLLREPPAAKPA